MTRRNLGAVRYKVMFTCLRVMVRFLGTNTIIAICMSAIGMAITFPTATTMTRAPTVQV